MKPMLVVLVLGIGFSVFMYLMGSSKPDGVVVERPYESAVRFEADRADMLSVKDVIDNFTAGYKDGKAYFSFQLHPERSTYSNVSVEDVSVSPVMGNPVKLIKDGDGFVSDTDLVPGWYNLIISVNADNKTIILKESTSLDKAQ